MAEFTLENKLEKVINDISNKNNIFIGDNSLIRNIIYAYDSLNEETISKINSIIDSIDFKSFSGESLDNFFYKIFGIERRKYYDNIVKVYARYNYDEVFEITAGSFFYYNGEYFYMKNNVVSFDKGKTINFSVEKTNKTIAESKNNFTEISDEFYIDVSRVNIEGDKVLKLESYFNIVNIEEDSSYEDDDSYLERCVNYFQNSCKNGKNSIKTEILKIPYVKNVEFVEAKINTNIETVLITQSDINKTKNIKASLLDVFEYFGVGFNIRFVDVVKVTISGLNKIFSYKIDGVEYSASTYFNEAVDNITKVLKSISYDYEKDVITIDYDSIINNTYSILKKLNKNIYIDDDKIDEYFSIGYVITNEGLTIDLDKVENNDIITFENKLLNLVIENA